MKGIHGGSTVGSLGCIFRPDKYRNAAKSVKSPSTTDVKLGVQLSTPPRSAMVEEEAQGVLVVERVSYEACSSAVGLSMSKTERCQAQDGSH